MGMIDTAGEKFMPPFCALELPVSVIALIHVDAHVR
jgi:hypothetical protein